MSFTSEPARSRWSDVFTSATANFFSSTASFLVMVTLILSLQKQHASGVQVAVLVLSEALPMVLLGTLIGRLVDRVDSRLLLIVAGAGQVAAALTLAGAKSYGAMISWAIVLSVLTGIAGPTRQALIPAMVTRDDLPRAMAIGQTAANGGMMFGPALAGFMVFGLGVHTTLQIAAIGFVATILGGLAIRTRRGGVTAEVTSEEAAVPEWKLRNDPLLWSSVWGLTAVVAALSAVNVVLVFFIMDTLHSNERVFGIVDATWTVGMLAGAWVYTRFIKPSTSDSALTLRLFVALGIASVALVAVGLAQQAIWTVPCYLIGGVQNAGLNVMGGTLLGRRVPPEARGRGNTAMSMRVSAGSLLGYLAGGLLLDWSQPRWIVIGCGVLGVVAVFAALPLVRRAGVSQNEKLRYAEAS